MGKFTKQKVGGVNLDQKRFEEIQRDVGITVCAISGEVTEVELPNTDYVFLLNTIEKQQQEIEQLKRVKEIEVYDNGVAKILYEDGDSMLINKVWYMDAILTGWDEKDIGNKR